LARLRSEEWKPLAKEAEVDGYESRTEYVRWILPAEDNLKTKGLLINHAADGVIRL
jgi:hypothetical protein